MSHQFRQRIRTRQGDRKAVSSRAVARRVRTRHQFSVAFPHGKDLNNLAQSHLWKQPMETGPRIEVDKARLGEFERELRRLLQEAASGKYDAELRARGVTL